MKRLLIDLLAGLWNSLGTFPRRWIAWTLNDKFVHGVCGIILDSEGRVLLLKHRFWKRQRWGLPGGMARRGETFAETLRRELREETGMEVHPVKLLGVTNAWRQLTVFALLAETSQAPVALSGEIIEARFWDRDALPPDLLDPHRRMIEEWNSGVPGIRLDSMRDFSSAN